MTLWEKIANREAQIAVIGLGYVGLPFAIEFARLGFRVVGLDVNADRIAELRRGESYIRDILAGDVASVVNSGHLVPTTDYETLRQVDIVFICVPTPFSTMKTPDLGFIIEAAEGIAARLCPGQLIILVSTTFPGTTEEVVLPILEKSGLRAGKDFYLAFSPERINPGDKHHTLRNTPKVVGGLTPLCADLSRFLLSQITPHVHVVSTPRAAEMTKLLENIYRSVNIALVNELAILSERMGINLWEVIEAAATKPFGYMPFTPGPGTGGHCIPVDPYYLSWKAREYDFFTKFIEIAAEVNQAMPYHVVQLVTEALNRRGRPLAGSRILVLGAAFKKDVDDARNSPSARVIELLLERGAQTEYHDPYVPHFKVGDDVFHRESYELTSVPLDAERLASSDCVVIVTGHSCHDYAWIVQHAPLVVDAVNATKGKASDMNKVVRLGAPIKLSTPEGAITSESKVSSTNSFSSTPAGI